METLYSFMKEVRKAANLSQGEIAEKMGFSSPQFVSNWERGISRVPLKHLKTFIKITKCDKEKVKELYVKDMQAQFDRKMEAKGLIE